MASPSSLATRQCIPCHGDTPPLPQSEAAALLAQIPGWSLDAEGHLRKTYRFRDFASALAYVDRVGATAEEQGHHPDLYLAWGKVEGIVWTHKIHGLTESDFIFAAKMDALYEGAAGKKEDGGRKREEVAS